jgi:hypothetical protein
VYRAKDTKLDREVAIKVLPWTLAQEPRLRHRRVGNWRGYMSSMNCSIRAQAHGLGAKQSPFHLKEDQVRR